MIIDYNKNFKRLNVVISLGFIGRIYRFGDVPKAYIENKNNEEYLKDYDYYKKNLTLILTPCIYFYKEEYRKGINFSWLFLNIYTSLQNE